MNGQWIEIFRTGEHTDAAGNRRAWTEADLDAIVAGYDPAQHEAPLVVGHPKDNSPAFGYVEALKREGGTLLMKPRQVPDEFTELVRKGTYKKRSISLYPDLTLRHVGFLGGMPPAVKGLKDIAFQADDEALTYEFGDYRISSVGRILQRFRDFLIDRFDLDTADRVVAPWEIEGLMAPAAEESQPAPPLFSEKEVQDMDKVKELQDQLAAKDAELREYAERVDALTAKNDELETRLKQMAKDSLDREFAAFCDSLPTRITPAQRPAVIAHMHTLAGLEPVDFAEGDGRTVKKTPLEIYQESLKNLPEVVSFAERAARERAAGREDDSPQALARKAREYVEEMAAKGIHVTCSEAVAQIRQGGEHG